MEAAVPIEPQYARSRYHLALLERLVEDVRRIEGEYPSWDCGLAAMCEAFIPANSRHGVVAAASDVHLRNLVSELTVLDARQQLGLVPPHEYRRQKRDINHRLRMGRLGRLGLPSRIVTFAAGVLTVCEDGLHTLIAAADGYCRWRLGTPR